MGDFKFGVSQTGAYGVFQSSEKGSEIDRAMVRSETGQAVEEKAYSKNRTRSVDFVINGSTHTGDEAGTVMTLGDLSVLVDNSNLTESNEDYARGTISGAKRDNATLVAYELTT